MDEKIVLRTNWESLAIRDGQKLPHWSCDGAVYHVTFRLVDSVPEAKRRLWATERASILGNAKAMGRELADHEIDKLRYLFSEKVEKYLDAGHGECHLSIPKVGEMVARTLAYFDGERYRLHAYCVMPNHTHVIFEPLFDFGIKKIVHSWTSYSATQANKILRRKGSFWQPEPYDHIIRSEREYWQQMEYVWNNPGNMRSGFVRWRRM